MSETDRIGSSTLWETMMAKSLTYRIEWSPLSWGKDQLKSEIDRDKVIWARGTTDQSLKNTDWNYFLIKW